VEIAGRPIGFGRPVFVVAEISANHDQDMKKAVRLIHEAKEAHADAVKLQTYTPDTLVNKDSPYYHLYKRAYMPWEWQPELKKLADDLDIVLFSTAYDKTSVDHLQKMNVPAYKVASFELTDLDLIRYIAATGKPVLLSLGMANWTDIMKGVDAVSGYSHAQLGLLKCTSSYPAQPQDMNLHTIQTLEQRFMCPVGLSNHCLDRAIPIAAVALGASIIEQHITLSKDSIDASFSLLPSEFAQMVQDVRITEKAMGNYVGPTKSEQAMLGLRRNPKTGKRGCESQA